MTSPTSTGATSPEPGPQSDDRGHRDPDRHIRQPDRCRHPAAALRREASVRCHRCSTGRAARAGRLRCRDAAPGARRFSAEHRTEPVLAGHGACHGQGRCKGKHRRTVGRRPGADRGGRAGRGHHRDRRGAGRRGHGRHPAQVRHDHRGGQPDLGADRFRRAPGVSGRTGPAVRSRRGGRRLRRRPGGRPAGHQRLGGRAHPDPDPRAVRHRKHRRLDRAGPGQCAVPEGGLGGTVQPEPEYHAVHHARRRVEAGHPDAGSVDGAGAPGPGLGLGLRRVRRSGTGDDHSPAGRSGLPFWRTWTPT